jgi:hypothetical protein
MITGTIKDIFATHVSKIRYETKDMLTDFDSDGNARPALATLLTHYFLLRYASRHLNEIPKFESLEHFADRNAALGDGTSSPQRLRDAQKEIEQNLRRLCKIHELDYDAAEAEARSLLDTPNRPSGQFHAEGDPSKAL